MLLTPVVLAELMDCPQARADECYPGLVGAMRTFGITSSAAVTCFLTQVRWESGGLVYFAELASGTAYNGRTDLGNIEPGDGPRFKGSGPIQVTGRANFTEAQAALDAAGIQINILADPDLARGTQYGSWISCWWWAEHGGNIVAQRLPLLQASIACGRLVNRGLADSQLPAQGEQGRISAFIQVNRYGYLELPDPQPEGLHMEAEVQAAFQQIAAALAAQDAKLAHIVTFVDGIPPTRNGQATRMVDLMQHEGMKPAL